MNVCNKCCKINTVPSTFGLLQVFPWNNEIFIEKNGCLEMMSLCDNKLLFLYACLKPRRYHNWYLWYLLATILALQKRCKSERMSGCSYSFTIEKRQFIERWLQLDFRISSVPLKKDTHWVCKKCPYSELFWSAFSRICTECREILSIYPYLVPMPESADQNNSEKWHFSRSDDDCRCLFKKHRTLENTRPLQLASWNNDGVTKMYGCKCSFENNTA